MIKIFQHVTLETIFRSFFFVYMTARTCIIKDINRVGIVEKFYEVFFSHRTNASLVLEMYSPSTHILYYYT